MKIEISFSDSDRALPHFEELSEFVSSILEQIPDQMDEFLSSLEVSHVKKKAQKACSEGVCQSRRNKAVKK